MSGKTLFPTEGSPPGISAGVPFVVNEFTYVEQVTPPFLATQRLARVADANQSIIAPGAAGGAHSLVIGEGAVDAGGPRAVLLGYQLQQNTGGGAAQSADQIMVGNSIVVPAASRNSQGLVAIGASIVFTAFLGVADSFGNSVVAGNTAGLVCLNAAGGDASNAVVLGAGALGHGGSVVIGATAADSGLTAVAIGQGAKAGLQAVAIGLNADATGDRNISIGDRARGGVATSGTIVLGWFADGANADSGIAIGQGANLNGKVANIMLGRNAGVALDYFCQIGGDATYPINEIRFGAGYTQATGGNAYTFGITTVFDGAGNNLAGNGLVIRSGLGTGNWANAQNLGIDFQVGIVQGAGSTQQPYTSVLALRHSDLNVALWGGMAAPFSAGKGVLFIKNAATNPAVAAVAGGGILSVQGGNLHFLNAAGVDTALTPAAGGGTVSSAGMTAGKIPIASAAQTIGDSIISVALGAVTIAGGLLSSDAGNSMVLETANVADPCQLNPNGVQGFSVSRQGPNGGLQIYPGADGAWPLGGTTGGNRRFSALFLTGAASLHIDNSTSATGAGALTLANGPAGKAGNPTKYLNVTIDGTNVVIPCW